MPQDSLSVKVFEKSLVGKDELGSVHMPLPDIIESVQVSRWTGEEQAGYMYRRFELANGDGASIELELEFLPYW